MNSGKSEKTPKIALRHSRIGLRLLLNMLAALVLAYTAFAAWYGDDVWFFLAALVGLAAKDIDLRGALRAYLTAAVAGLLFVQFLHFATPLMPYNFYCRNWDFGYGHYNGFGARLIGVFFAWAWLRHDRMRWFDWAGLAALLAFYFRKCEDVYAVLQDGTNASFNRAFSKAWFLHIYFEIKPDDLTVPEAAK